MPNNYVDDSNYDTSAPYTPSTVVAGDYTQQTGYADPYDSRIGGGALPTGIQGTQNRAYTRTVQNPETARGQMEGLLGDNSLYMQNARLQGEEFANSRGLLNSSMAAGNSQRAAIEAGLPIALNDSGVYSRTASENMGALNTRALADLASETQRAGYSAQMSIAGMNNAGALQRQREELAFQGEQRALDRDWNLARDNYNYHYDLGRYDRQTQNNISEYGAITRINYQQQNRNFWDGMMQLHAADPETFDLETVGGIFNTYMGVSDDLEFDLSELLGW